MFNPSKAARLFAGAAAWLPLAAMAGVTTGGAPPEPPSRAAPAAPSTAGTPKANTGSYQVRCWQYGRLLFEENHIALPVGNGRYGIKLAGTDPRGKPIYIADTDNATCLIRAASEAVPPR
jgi:hypothetical protein